MKLKIQKLYLGAKLPTYGTDGSAAFDLSTCNGETIHGFGSKVFGTGLAVEVPDGHVMLLFSRSGHGFSRDLRLSNAVGVIDSDYRGEVMVKLRNDGPREQRIERGERIAQALVLPVARCDFELVEELSSTERGAGGFGSTGAA